MCDILITNIDIISISGQLFCDQSEWWLGGRRWAGMSWANLTMVDALIKLRINPVKPDAINSSVVLSGGVYGRGRVGRPRPVRYLKKVGRFLLLVICKKKIRFPQNPKTKS